MLPRFWRFRAAARKCFGNSGNVYPSPSSLSTISLASSINSPRCSLAILPNTIILSFFVLMKTYAIAGKEEYRSAQTLFRSAIASVRSALFVRWEITKLTRHDTASTRLAPLSSQSTHTHSGNDLLKLFSYIFPWPIESRNFFISLGLIRVLMMP